MLKPTPSLPPPLEAIELLIPMTSPFMFTSGPPELPGLIAASVWRKSWFSTSWSSSTCRPRALMIPWLTEWVRPNGLPECQDPVADRDLVTVAEPGGGQVVATQVEHGDVGLGVEPEPVGVERPGRPGGRC